LWKPEKIISGGQTGADLGGLVGAERCGIQTGGAAPKNFKTEVGCQPVLQSRFNLHAHASSHYEGRTRENILNSDGTLIFATQPGSAGTKLTIRICAEENKPWCLIDPNRDTAVFEIRKFVENLRPQILNIAGNRESVSPGITKAVANLIENTFQPFNAI
jgi:hypothetical protein